jgi:polar amino acid transport system substrate-binding protein
MLHDVFLSQPVIAFHNRVFTLGKTTSVLDDMKTLEVSAFQRARQVLRCFASMADQNPRYEEVASSRDRCTG